LEAAEADFQRFYGLDLSVELDDETGAGVARLFALVRALPVYKGAFAVLHAEQAEVRKTRSLSDFVKRVRGK
jgi:hypothetical protein